MLDAVARRPSAERSERSRFHGLRGAWHAALAVVLACACRPAPAPEPATAEPAPAPIATDPPSPIAATEAHTPGSSAGPERQDSAKDPDPTPLPFEVTVQAVVADKARGEARQLVVDIDPRFVVRIRITSVEPTTTALEPGLYDLAIHSPARAFGGGEPPPGRQLRLRLTVHPPIDDDTPPSFSGLRVE